MTKEQKVFQVLDRMLADARVCIEYSRENGVEGYYREKDQVSMKTPCSDLFYQFDNYSKELIRTDVSDYDGERSGTNMGIVCDSETLHAMFDYVIARANREYQERLLIVTCDEVKAVIINHGYQLG